MVYTRGRTWAKDEINVPIALSAFRDKIRKNMATGCGDLSRTSYDVL